MRVLISFLLFARLLAPTVTLTVSTTEASSSTPRITSTTSAQGLSGEIWSPDYPSVYPSYTDETWNLEVALGQKILLSFQTFDIEFSYSCRYDYVQISEGSVEHKYCGSDVPSPILSSGNTMNVTFHSKYNNYHDNHNGFKASWDAVAGNHVMCPDSINNGNFVHYFKEIRNQIIESANHMAGLIEERRERSGHIEFDFSPSVTETFELNYKYFIARYSEAFLTYMDHFHSYLSWGVFPESEVVRDWWGYRYQSHFVETNIAGGEKSLDEIVSQFSEKTSCLLEAFEDDSSILQTYATDSLSENLNRHIRNVSSSLKNVLQSEQTPEMIQMMYELTKSEIKSINYNTLLPSLYYFSLQLKKVLMKPDINDFFPILNQTDYFIQESVWKFNTGRWPEMEKFVDNFLRRTVGSIVFWDRLTGQFSTEMKNKMLDWLGSNDFLANIDPLVETLISLMERIADGDKIWLRKVFKDIRESNWDKSLTWYINVIGEELGSCNLATCASYLVYSIYADIHTLFINKDFLQPIKTLLFSDWPQEEIYPDSIDDFFRSIYNLGVSMSQTTVYGNSFDDQDNV